MSIERREIGPPTRASLLALAVGAAAGAAVYLFVPTPLIAVAVAAVYAPLAYLCLRDPDAALERLFQSNAPRRVRIAQTCGVFGTGVGIGLFVARMRPGGFGLAFGVWLAGVALFFVLLPNYGARRRAPW